MGGEQVNLFMSGLLDQGFSLLRTSGQLPAPADDWLLEVTPGAARLLARDDTIAYDGPITQPGPWLHLVRRAQACVVLIGTIGLYAHADDEMTTADLRRLLNRAAKAGELAGAIVLTDVAGRAAT